MRGLGRRIRRLGPYRIANGIFPETDLGRRHLSRVNRKDQPTGVIVQISVGAEFFHLFPAVLGVQRDNPELGILRSRYADVADAGVRAWSLNADDVVRAENTPRRRRIELRRRGREVGDGGVCHPGHGLQRRDLRIDAPFSLFKSEV
jgi:hypothetical protein